MTTLFIAAKWKRKNKFGGIPHLLHRLPANFSQTMRRVKLLLPLHPPSPGLDSPRLLLIHHPSFRHGEDPSRRGRSRRKSPRRGGGGSERARRGRPDPGATGDDPLRLLLRGLPPDASEGVLQSGALDEVGRPDVGGDQGPPRSDPRLGIPSAMLSPQRIHCRSEAAPVLP